MTVENLGNPAPAKLAFAFPLLRAALTLVFLAIAAGCSSTDPRASGSPAPPRKAAGSPLRVAITPDYPPLVSAQGDSFVGAEIDLARALGQELQRPVEFVSLKRDKLITALQDGRADIVMSGMSVTKARQFRAAFTAPYLQNQLRAIFRRADADRFRGTNDIRSTTARIGVLPGTTADVYVQKNCQGAQRVALQYRRDAVFFLTAGGKIDLFIDDLFALAQLVSQNEADVAFLREPLAIEDLAWAVAPGDPELLRQVNEILARWKSDGSLERTLLRWMPYVNTK